MKISAIILTKNEKYNIERAIKSVKFCDEVMVIRNDSIDDFAKERNSAMERVKNEWVLFIDADEVVTEELKKEIVSLFHGSIDKKIVAFYLRRRDFFWGRELRWGEVRKIRQKGIIRLMRKNSGKWVGKVHEEFKPVGTVGRLNSYLNHYPHQSVKDFLHEINFYSTLRARELKEIGEMGGIGEIILFPLGKFILTYFLKFGFLDGAAGFAYAFFMSFHSFLVRAKLWQYAKINKFNRHSGKR